VYADAVLRMVILRVVRVKRGEDMQKLESKAQLAFTVTQLSVLRKNGTNLIIYRGTNAVILPLHLPFLQNS
jgi:hypothetical protein